jgi:hypothetical protein
MSGTSKRAKPTTSVRVVQKDGKFVKEPGVLWPRN